MKTRFLQIRFSQVLTLLTAILFSTFAAAEQKFVKNDWDIHYIAFPSSFIEPEVASTYNLQRSKYKAVINISVLDNQNNDKAQNAFVKGVAKNLLGQTQNLEFVKVQEGDAIYFLAQFQHRNDETFNITVDIQQGNRVETIKFSKKMYVD